VERVETVIAAEANSQAPLNDLARTTQHFEDALHDATTDGTSQESPLLEPGEKESAGSSAAVALQGGDRDGSAHEIKSGK
jgi:hypothetical protein